MIAVAGLGGRAACVASLLAVLAGLRREYWGSKDGAGKSAGRARRRVGR